MPSNSTQNLLPQDRASQEGSTVYKFYSWKKFGIWIAGVAVSILPLLVTPLVKFGWQDGYKNWFNDIFGNNGIIIVSVSLAVPALFQFFSKRQSKFIFLLAVFLFILVVSCIFAYTAVTSTTILADMIEYEKQPQYPMLGRINVLILVIMFILSAASFFEDKKGE